MADRQISYFKVINLDKFQHYKDRNPPWIKYHNTLLDNYEFSSLPDASKAHLSLIWLLASRHDNKLPWDEKWIAEKIGAKSKINLNILLSAGFIDKISHASNVLADCRQVALLDRGETEDINKRREEDGSERTALPASAISIDLDSDLKKLLTECPYLSLISNGASSDFWDKVLAACAPYPMADSRWLSAKIRGWDLWLQNNAARRSTKREKLEGRIMGWLLGDLEKVARRKT